jgi:two-component system phosphate regulon sensor histidine kinase PhoR
MKDKIFQRVYGKSKTVGGMGLGLSLVKKILNLYDGDIRVEDKIKGEHQKGSNFIILLPVYNQ